VGREIPVNQGPPTGHSLNLKCNLNGSNMDKDVVHKLPTELHGNKNVEDTNDAVLIVGDSVTLLSQPRAGVDVDKGKAVVGSSSKVKWKKKSTCSPNSSASGTFC
jgi:hypothetical protein